MSDSIILCPHPHYPHIAFPATETWKAVPGFEGYYEVSTWGNVKSLERVRLYRNGAAHIIREKVLKPQKNSTGYLHVDLRKNGPFMRLVHQLVLKAFIGPRPDGMEACHDDGNRQNNRLENLRWDTAPGNRADMVRHGTHVFGEEHPNAKLTEQLVVALRADRAAGMSERKLVAKYKVCRGTIRAIVRRKSWKHV